MVSAGSPSGPVAAFSVYRRARTSCSERPSTSFMA